MKSAALTHPETSGPRGFFDRALECAPVRPLSALVGEGPVIVLAPHPDDESIGCGGLIAACASAGVSVFVHVLTDGRHSHLGSPAWPPERIAAQREAEAREAAHALGLPQNALTFERAIDGTLLFDWQGATTIAERIAGIASGFEAPVLVAPWRGDPHPDHIAAAAIADMIEQAHARIRGLRYLIWAHGHPDDLTSGIEADSVLRFAIGDWRARKQRAINAHRTQTTGLISDALYGRGSVPDLADFLGPFECYLTSKA